MAPDTSSVLASPEVITLQEPQSLEPRAIRNVLGTYPTGVAIVTTRAPDGRPVGLTINSFASVSLSPPIMFGEVTKVWSKPADPLVFHRGRLIGLADPTY